MMSKVSMYSRPTSFEVERVSASASASPETVCSCCFKIRSLEVDDLILFFALATATTLVITH